MTIGKLVALLVIAALVASSAAIVNAVSVQDIPKPSVPEFTLRLAHHPYDVAPMTTIDPYTGKSVTTQDGYHAENRSIEVVIKNQHFSSSYTDSAGNNIALLYNIRWKGNFEDTWKYCAGVAATFDNTKDYVHASGSADTVAVGGLSWNEESAGYNFFIAMPSEGSQGGQVDFQVKALLGYSNRVYAGDMIPLGATYYYNFTGVESDWSNTQTFEVQNGVTSIPDSSTKNPQPTQSTTTPIQTDLPATQTQLIKQQSSAMFFFENTSIIAFGVSFILLGSLLVLLAFSHKRSIGKVKC